MRNGFLRTSNGREVVYLEALKQRQPSKLALQRLSVGVGCPHRDTAESISRQPISVSRFADIRRKGLVKTMSRNVYPFQGELREHAGTCGWARVSR